MYNSASDVGIVYICHRHLAKPLFSNTIMQNKCLQPVVDKQVCLLHKPVKQIK